MPPSPCLAHERASWVLCPLFKDYSLDSMGEVLGGVHGIKTSTQSHHPWDTGTELLLGLGKDF